MTWNTHHRRGEVLRAVIDRADDRVDGVLPTDVTGVAETFADHTDLLAALTLRWHTRLAGRIESLSAAEDLAGRRLGAPAEVLIEAYALTAQDLPGIRAVLDNCSQAPESAEMERVVRTSARKEQAMLGHWAGAREESEAVRTGAALISIAREDVRAHHQPARSGGLMGRIRGALAA